MLPMTEENTAFESSWSMRRHLSRKTGRRFSSSHLLSPVLCKRTSRNKHITYRDLMSSCSSVQVLCKFCASSVQAPCSLGVVLQAAGIHLPIRFKMLRSMLQADQDPETFQKTSALRHRRLCFGFHPARVPGLALDQLCLATACDSVFLNGLPCGVACHPWHLFDEGSEEGILLGLADVSMSLSLCPNNMSELDEYIYIYPNIWYHEISWNI